jgi:uncharacterized repeat protein (TIGR03803 family)
MKSMCLRAVASIATACVISLLAQAAQAQTYEVLYTFTGGSDGAAPMAELMLDAKGNLYGTTSQGGASGYGTVFKLDTSGKETVLHRFTGYPTDGAYPTAGLIQDAEGNLYGTTANGGAGPCGYVGEIVGCGTVFKLSKSGKETVLYSFCTGSECTDGSYPSPGSLIPDAKGNLYGTTQWGGDSNNGGTGGTVFRLSATGRETVLHSFKGDGDGSIPYGGVIRDEKGNLYGTTNQGGAYDEGTVFQLSKTGAETLLHSFVGYRRDGAYPPAGLIQDAKGNFYGVTFEGGHYSDFYGTVFKLSKTGKETVVYSFCPGGGGCVDGERPNGSVIRDAKGNLYGTTSTGGAYGGCVCGTVFKVDTSGKETVLYSFPLSGSDGVDPLAGLVRDAKGNLYGTTYSGGSSNCYFGCGVVFKLTP